MKNFGKHLRILVDVNGWNSMIDTFDISELDMTDFPFRGAFYTYEVNEDAPLDERVPQEVKIFETACDIQRRGKLGGNGLNGAEYVVYFPLELNSESADTSDKYGPVKVRRGMTFRSDPAYGYTCEGVVEFVRLSQLGACSCDVKITTESEV